MKKEYKLLKLRFSYFLIIGLIGLFLIGISFFVWNSTSITPTMIMTKITSSNPQFKKYLNNYMAPQKVQLVGYLFLVIMSCGFFFASKKKDIEIRIGSIIEFVSNFSCLILVIIELIFAYTNRTTFLLKKNDGFINWLNYFYVLSLLVNAIGFSFLGNGMHLSKKQDVIGKIGIYAIYGSCFLFVSYTLFFFINNAINSSFKALNSFYSAGISYPYSTARVTMNIFSLTQFQQLSLNIEEISVNKFGSPYIYILGYLYQIIFLVYLLGAIIFVTTILIQSFDIDKDDNPMSI